MADLAEFESVMYLRQAVIVDALVRLLGDPVARLRDDPPRQLAFPPGAGDPQIRCWWDKPAVEIGDDATATLSVALSGGVRQVSRTSEPGRIGSLQGTLKARARVGMTYREGAAHLLLSAEKLDLQGLRVQYADSNPLPLLGFAGEAGPPQAAIARAMAADALASAELAPLLLGLMAALSRFPLSYRASILTGVTAAAPEFTSQVEVFQTRAGPVVAIGASRTGSGAGPRGKTKRLGNLLKPPARSNMAIQVTSRWLTARLAHLLRAGTLARRLLDTNGNEVAHVEALDIALHRGYVTLTGYLSRGAQQAAVAVNLRLTVDGERHYLGVDQLGLQVQVAEDAPATNGGEGLGPGRQDASQELAIALGQIQPTYWAEALGMLLGMRYHDGVVELVEQVQLPDATDGFDVPIDALDLDEGTLTLYCSVPAAPAFEPEKPDQQPQVTLVQQTVPQQETPDQPVMAEVEAQVTSDSFTPYDYAWKTDSRLYRFVLGLVPAGLLPLVRPVIARLPPRVLPRHQNLLPVTGVPSGIRGDPEPLGTAQVVVIDGFGQVAKAKREVVAHPAPLTRPQERIRRSVRAATAASAALLPLIVLVGIGSASAWMVGHLAHSQPSMGSGFLVAPLVTQVCVASQAMLPPSEIALDNTAGATGISWQATIEGSVPETKESWATFANGATREAGNLAAGSQAFETVQPAADLCERAVRVGVRQFFHIRVDYSGGHQISLTETVDLFLVEVHVVAAPTVPQSQTGPTTLTQSCNQFDQSNPVQPFLMVLDNGRSTLASAYQVTISDLPPIAPYEPTPPPSSSPVYWAQADAPSGTLPAGRSVSVTITPLSTLCQGLPPGTLTQYFHVRITYGGVTAVTVTDSIGPQVIG